MRRTSSEMKTTKTEGAITESQWADLPMLLDVPDVALVLRCSKRWVSDHAEELGGTKVANHWRFGKTRIAELLGM